MSDQSFTMSKVSFITPWDLQNYRARKVPALLASGPYMNLITSHDLKLSV